MDRRNAIIALWSLASGFSSPIPPKRNEIPDIPSDTKTPPADVESQNLDGFFNIMDFGADNSGKSDCSNAIQTALYKAKAGSDGKNNRSGVVYAPSGKYLLEKSVNFDDCHDVIFLGAGWGHNDDRGGTWFIVSQKLSHHPAFNVNGIGAQVRNIAIAHEQPNPRDANFKPNRYDFAISVRADNVVLQNVFLLNPTHGVQITRGRAFVDRLYGQPLTTGVSVVGTKDNVYIQNVHFWRFWKSSDPVSEWMFNHAKAAFLLEAADHPFFTNVFAVGYARGIWVTGDKPTRKMVVANASFDSTCMGFVASESSGSSGSITNLNVTGARADSEYGIYVTAKNAHYQFTNTIFSKIGKNLVRVENSNDTTVILNGIHGSSWNYQHPHDRFPAIEALDGAIIQVFGADLSQPENKKENPWAHEILYKGNSGGKVLVSALVDRS